MTIYLFDTSIWLDYYEKRGAKSEQAFRLLLKIIDEDSIIVYSDLHVRELKGLGYSFDEISNIFKIAKPNNIRRAHISREQIHEATRLASLKKIPKKDALHAIIARDNEAIMVATDKHFGLLSHIVKTKRPEELY